MSCQELAGAKSETIPESVYSSIGRRCWIDQQRMCDKTCVAYNNERIPCKFIERLDAIVTVLEEWEAGDYGDYTVGEAEE